MRIDVSVFQAWIKRVHLWCTCNHNALLGILVIVASGALVIAFFVSGGHTLLTKQLCVRRIDLSQPPAQSVAHYKACLQLPDHTR